MYLINQSAKLRNFLDNLLSIKGFMRYRHGDKSNFIADGTLSFVPLLFPEWQKRLIFRSGKQFLELIIVNLPSA